MKFSSQDKFFEILSIFSWSFIWGLKMHNAGWIILLVEITIQKYIYIYSDKLH